MNTIRGRLVLILLLTQAVLAPPVLFAISFVVERAMSELFVDDARAYGQVFAAELMSAQTLGDRDAVLEQLDTAILGGHCVYAVLTSNGNSLASTLMLEANVADFREDFEFGANGDETYFLSVPITGGNYMAILQLGFDESPVHASLASIRRAVLYVLLAFLGMSIGLTTIVSSTIVNPLKRLQSASRSISSGDVSHGLRSTSGLEEIHDLSRDLEIMRQKLVGMTERLQEEIKEKELAEAERRGMEAFLRQAQRLESLGTLAGGVAHEFNNVLQPILLYTELAIDRVSEDSMTATNLKRVLELARRAQNLSRQILMFGRREDVAEFRVVDIGEVVHEAVTMIRALLPATVNIRTKIGADVGPVNCDPAQIKQLVVNLCNNASQALSRPEDYIEVSLNEVLVTAQTKIPHVQLKPGEYVVLQVADSGRGMDEDTVQRIFEPFFTTRDVGEGTGLGLSVVHGIVAQHEGDISVESSSGKGSRFRIYLPLADETAIETDNRGERDEQDPGN
jgi:signal transduction histidine kinase